MSTTVQAFIRSFESLPELEKREVAYEIMRRSLELNLPPRSDEELILNAEGLFLGLDRSEAQNGRSKSRRGLVG